MLWNMREVQPNTSLLLRFVHASVNDESKENDRLEMCELIYESYPNLFNVQDSVFKNAIYAIYRHGFSKILEFVKSKIDIPTIDKYNLFISTCNMGIMEIPEDASYCVEGKKKILIELLNSSLEGSGIGAVALYGAYKEAKRYECYPIVEVLRPLVK